MYVHVYVCCICVSIVCTYVALQGSQLTLLKYLYDFNLINMEYCVSNNMQWSVLWKTAWIKTIEKIGNQKKKNEKIFDKKLNLNKNKVIEKKEVFCITYCKLFKLHLLLVSYW